MNRYLIAALKQITSSLSDMQLEDLAYTLESWSSSPNPVSFADMVETAESLDESFREYEWDVYRGQTVSQDQLASLKSGRSIKIKAGSWSTDETEAQRFAEGGRDPHVSIVYEYKPKSGDVVVNLVDVVEDETLNKYIEQSTIEGIQDEREILLNEVQVTKANIYSGHFTIYLDEEAKLRPSPMMILEKKISSWKSKYGDIELNEYGNSDIIWVQANTPDLFELMAEMLEELGDFIDKEAMADFL